MHVRHGIFVAVTNSIDFSINRYCKKVQFPYSVHISYRVGAQSKAGGEVTSNIDVSNNISRSGT